MKAITLRNVPPEVARAIQRRAAAAGTSFNKAVLSLVEEGAGVGRRRARKKLHHDLDELSGRWTREEASAFEKALAEQRTIDPDLWR